ncbi:hypothetical protein AB4Y40_35500 [Paraburkholderia sp. EG287B]|uniref:hypothetical protein n=1 Tax=Paraburkholderia sp. EG287B TaxID=3237010 RepID=UPI0034D37A5D
MFRKIFPGVLAAAARSVAAVPAAPQDSIPNMEAGKSMDEMHRDAGESAERKALIDISLEGWRFARVFGRLLDKLDAGDAPRHANQARYFQKKIDDGLSAFGLRLVSLEGQTYDPGMAVSALNIADFGADDYLVIDQMIEPVVMGPEGLVRGGTVMLAKAERQ